MTYEKRFIHNDVDDVLKRLLFNIRNLVPQVIFKCFEFVSYFWEEKSEIFIDLLKTYLNLSYLKYLNYV
jgi:hypothetical protein